MPYGLTHKLGKSKRLLLRGKMKEIYRTNDLMEMNRIQHLLREHDIESFPLDVHSGALFSGIGGILPRLMVIDDHFEPALKILQEAGFGRD